MSKQPIANQNVGVWIDHKEAFVVFSQEDLVDTQSITSGMEKHVRYFPHLAETGGLAEDQRDKRFDLHLNRYYDDVIAHLHDATSIFIFGPGEAKGEFKKRLEHVGLSGRVVGFETVDKLTNHQIAAKVQAYFQK